MAAFFFLEKILGLWYKKFGNLDSSLSQLSKLCYDSSSYKQS